MFCDKITPNIMKSGTVNVRTICKYKNNVENAYLYQAFSCNFQKCQQISTKMLKNDEKCIDFPFS